MKTRRKKKNILLRIAVVAFSIYIVVMLVQLRLEINQKQMEQDILKEKISERKRANENLVRQSANLEEYLEQQAREQGWALPGEVILIEIPGIDS